MTRTASQVTEFLRQSEQLPAHDADLTPKLFDGFVRTARHIYDADHGGFGDAPKFPHALDLRLLLRMWKRTGDS